MKSIGATVLLSVFSAGCGAQGATPIYEEMVDMAQGADAAERGADSPLAVEEIAEVPEEELLFGEVPELQVPEVLPACEPGTGCFLDPCGEGGDCLSGLCVEHMGDPVCTVECVEECPEGWECKQVYAGPDMSFACISPFTHLCRPCHDNADCKSPTGVEDVCVSYGENGSFCGAACAVGDDCPKDFVCEEATGVEGGTPGTQCVPESGECSCSKKASQLGLSTDCHVENEHGKCLGKRSCSQEGLSACDAGTPAVETCNGVDDDCDGKTDDVECNDGNACTKDSCEGVDGCEFLPLAGVECDDGDICTSGDHCIEGVCSGATVDCDDGDECTDDACVPDQGCAYTYNWSPCDDSDLCTHGEMCVKGVCGKGVATECDDGNPCTYDDCMPETGCLHTNNAAPCSDGNICTVGDACGSGACNAGTDVLDCDDLDACTEDACEPQSGCAHALRSCDDDDLCTIDSCLAPAGTCIHATVAVGCGACSKSKCDPSTGKAACEPIQVNCNDGNPCTDDECNDKLGCVHSANALACDDGNVCTLGDLCAGAACAPGAGSLDCDDGNLCTADVCDPAVGCQHAPADGACDDGNACTTLDHCGGGKCVAGGIADCDDDNPCTKDSCKPDTGCSHSPTSQPCSDGNVCTTGDACVAGACSPSAVLDCDDGNLCTDDSCHQTLGCQHTPNDAPCDDADACTLTDNCEGGACSGTGEPDCDDNDVCTDDACDSKVGCTHTHNTASCDDGNACTGQDACADGLCIGGPPPDCNDNDVCTDDECDSAEGCKHVGNTAPCDDGDPCTSDDTCDHGACVPGPALSCDDGIGCTTDSCTQAGCTHSWAECYVQPGPDEGMDHVIGSVYSIDPNGTMDHIRTGGWGDNYWALLQFPIDKLPPKAKSATIWLFGMNDNNSPTQMYFDRVTSQWAENCTWGNKPSYTNLKSIPPSQVGVWYSIDVTDLYNGWKAGTWPNYGVQLRSHGTWNNYNGFWSSDYTEDPTLRPKLAVEP